MNFRNRHTVLLGVLLWIGILNAQPSRSQDAQDPLISSMVHEGVAKVAIASQPPYAYLSGDGTPKGYLIDITNQVIRALGIAKLDPTVTTWDSMIPGLQAQQFNFIPAGLSITAARCEVVAFSDPVQVQQDALYVKPGKETMFTGYASVANAPDAVLAVLAGSLQEAFAIKSNIRRSQLISVPDIQAGVAAVLGGRAGAFAVGQFSVPDPEKRGVVRVIDKTSPVSGIGLAFRKENSGARDAFNKQLQVLRENGIMKTLYVDVYGHNNWEILANTKKASDIAPNCT